MGEGEVGGQKITNYTSGGGLEPVSIWCDHHLPHAVQHISFT